jgi:hypothetical protein
MPKVVNTVKKCHCKMAHRPDHQKERVMIELTMTETARTELLKVLQNIPARSIRLIRQGFG